MLIVCILLTPIAITIFIGSIYLSMYLFLGTCDLIEQLRELLRKENNEQIPRRNK